MEKKDDVINRQEKINNNSRNNLIETAPQPCLPLSMAGRRGSFLHDDFHGRRFFYPTPPPPPVSLENEIKKKKKKKYFCTS